MKEPKYVQLCPICGGKNIVFFKEDKVAGAIGVEMYECTRCGNVFAFPLELPVAEARKLKEVPLKKRMLKATPESAFIPIGNIEIFVYWKILGLAMLFVGIFVFLTAFLPAHCYVQNGVELCRFNNIPHLFAYTGLALIAAGIYFLIETYELTHSRKRQSRIMKAGLVLALLVVVFTFGLDSIVAFSLP